VLGMALNQVVLPGFAAYRIGIEGGGAGFNAGGGEEREGEEAPYGFGRPRRSAQLVGPETRDRARSGGDRHAGVDECLELGFHLERAQADGPDLADRRRPGTESRCFEVDDDEGRPLEEELGPGRLRERDRVAVPRKARVGLDDLGQERPREGDRRLAQREQPACRVLRGHRSAALFDEFHKSVGRV